MLLLIVSFLLPLFASLNKKSKQAHHEVLEKSMDDSDCDHSYKEIRDATEKESNSVDLDKNMNMKYCVYVILVKPSVNGSFRSFVNSIKYVSYGDAKRPSQHISSNADLVNCLKRQDDISIVTVLRGTEYESKWRDYSSMCQDPSTSMNLWNQRSGNISGYELARDAECAMKLSVYYLKEAHRKFICNAKPTITIYDFAEIYGTSI